MDEIRLYLARYTRTRIHRGVIHDVICIAYNLRVYLYARIAINEREKRLEENV